LAVAILSNKWANVGPFWMAQIVGAFVGALLVWLVYLPHWKETPDASAKLGIFCTIPAIRKLQANFLCEMIVTIVLVVVGFSFGSKELAPAGLAPGFSPWFWGVLVWVLGLSLGGPTGYAINPARDFGPRLAHAVLPISGKGGSDWGYALIPIVAPLVGGALAAGVVKLAGIS
jgi:glycerol uptake facilitator protein